MVDAEFLKQLCSYTSVLTSQNKKFELVRKNQLLKLLFADNSGLDPTVIFYLDLNFASSIECHKTQM